MSMLCASDPTGRAFASKIEMRLERPIGVQNLENRFGANHVQDVISDLWRSLVCRGASLLAVTAGPISPQRNAELGRTGLCFPRCLAIDHFLPLGQLDIR